MRATTLSITTHVIMTHSIMGLVTTLSITTHVITKLSIMGLVTTLSKNDTQHNNKECNYAECHDYLNVMLSVVRLNVVMLSVITT